MLMEGGLSGSRIYSFAGFHSDYICITFMKYANISGCFHDPHFQFSDIQRPSSLNLSCQRSALTPPKCPLIR